MEQIHILFKTARELQGIRQVNLAEAIEIKQQSITSFERGKASLSRQTLEKMAKVLALNPDYLMGKSRNPFKSQELIKMLLPERYASGIDYDILYLLENSKIALDVIFLFAPQTLLQKLFRNALGDLAFAIAVKDEDENVFIFKRKAKAPLFGTQELEKEMAAKAREGGIHPHFAKVDIDADLFEKIRNWNIVKEDLLPLFSNAPRVVLTDAERGLILLIRKKGMDPQQVEGLIDGK